MALLLAGRVVWVPSPFVRDSNREAGATDAPVLPFVSFAVAWEES